MDLHGKEPNRLTDLRYLRGEPVERFDFRGALAPSSARFVRRLRDDWQDRQ